MTYKLTYYDCQGRAELIRLIFHAAGENFFDERLNEKPKDKQCRCFILFSLNRTIQKR